jgi:hypothetical protein
MDELETGLDAGGGGEPAESQVYELNPDALIKPPGANEPVKWSDWAGRHVDKSEFTRKTQELARERDQFQRERQQAEHLLRQRAEELARTAQGGGTRGAAAQGALADLIQQVQGLPYIDGATLGGLLGKLQEQLDRPTQEFGKRDQAMALLYKQLQDTQKQLQGIQQASRGQNYQGLLRSTAKQLGLTEDDETLEVLRDIYESHEPGDELDREFPELARKRFDAIRKMVRGLDKAEADRARKAALPGRGGQGSPSKSLQPKGTETAREIAEQFWPGLQADSVT